MNPRGGGKNRRMALDPDPLSVAYAGPGRVVNVNTLDGGGARMVVDESSPIVGWVSHNTTCPQWAPEKP